MAEPSPFLQYQDKNGDFLIDECETDLPGPIEKVCLDCVPNPKAIVQDWKSNLGYPFLNEKLCLYQVGVKTTHTDTGGDSGIIDRFEFYKEDAIELFLDEYGKASSFENIEKLRSEIIYDPQKDFDLPARALSRLILLYSVPFDVLENLEDADDDEDDTEREPIEVTYLASELPILMTRIRKGLNLYSRYVKADSIMSESSLVFTKTQAPFNIWNYGDSGFGKKSVMAQVLNELDQWLNTKGFNIVGFGAIGFGRDRVVKITFCFSKKLKLRKLKVFSIGCREKPKVFKGRKLSGLNRKESFKDKTAMNYLARLTEMERDLIARKPKHFTDFIQEHTYPEVTFFNKEEILEGDRSCVAEAARNAIGALGQELINDVLSIGDILAYQFHLHACRDDKEETELRKEFGEFYQTVNEQELENLSLFGNKKEGKDKKTGVLSKGSRKAMTAMAAQQAYEKLQTNPNVFVQLCGSFLIDKTGLGGKFEARDIWDGSLDELKLCGFLDFLLDAIACLWGGLELEEALLIAVTSALKAMGLENFGSLFVGLPPEEQAELDELVKRKLAEARQKAATPQTSAQDEQRDSVDADAAVLPWRNITFVKPFEDPELLAQEQAARTPGSYGGTTVSSGMYRAESGNYGIRPRVGTAYNSPEEISGRQTPAEDAIKSLDKRAGETFDSGQIMEAYIEALVEFYSGRLLDLVDLLNDFPGAEIISKILAIIDCPRPPLFTPSIMDFLKDIELPFCRNIADIALPKIFIPPVNLADLWKRILEAIKEAIIQAVLNILFKLFVKICEIIGSAICKALETVGKIAGNLPGLISGNTTIRDIVRENICGPGASNSQVDDSIASMFELLGGAGASLANQDRVLALNEAIASASTRQEIIDASLGNASQEFLISVETVIEAEFPEFQEAFPNKQAIANFFTNFGNILPPGVKGQLEDIREGSYDNLNLPANPTLCASREQIEEFCNLRAQILDGRASPAQIAQLCENTLPAQDFGDLNEVLQNGLPATIMDNLPPIVSDPGCNNGLFPREPESLQNAAAQSLSGDLDNLRVAYSHDMLGNGMGKKNWGYMNMVLSDTMGRPFTNHVRNANRFSLFGPKKYVDFYVDQREKKEDEQDNRSTPSIFGYAQLRKQRGAFPLYVGEWLFDYWNNAPETLKVNEPNNELTDKKTFRVESDGDITALPDFGYNYRFEPTEDGYKVIKKKRKKRADIVLNFRDNRDGENESPNYEDIGMTFGSEIKLFFAEPREGTNTPDNNVRVMIKSRLNYGNFFADFAALQGNEFSTGPVEEQEKGEASANKISENKIFEFLGTDGGVDELLEQIEDTTYPRFESTFQELGSESPLIVLMSEMLGISNSSAKTFWSNTTEEMMNSMAAKVFTSENQSFLYGAKPDILNSDDAEYGVGKCASFKPYYELTNSDGDPLTNDDGVMGQSRDQACNGDKARIFYLDPAQFGGSYTNPKVYVKPVDNEGMLGLVNVMFPELSPCKPKNTDLVDFGDIAAKISNSYSNHPDDPRLIGDPDCIVERPFDRVLPRSAKAGIEGTISAACRIFASVHFLRSINTFAIFKPDFKNNLSSMYASFILEDMEKGMKDSQGRLGEFFNPFKDDEFWYAFLEQSVQTYFGLIQTGKIVDIPTDVERALERIGDAQNEYKYPGKKKLKNAKKAGNAPLFQTLTQFREDKNLAAIKAVEDDCKIVLKEFMIEEVNFIANVFYENMLSEGFIKREKYINNLMYYILSNESGLVAGSELSLIGDIVEAASAIDENSNYTNGDEFALEDGTPYVGYFHRHTVQEDDPSSGIKAGDVIYMVGEEHSSEPHDILRPFANKVTVNSGNGETSIGDVAGSNNTSKPFYIRKIMKVNGVVEDYSSARVSQLAQEGGDKLVSELYPGTMEHVFAPAKYSDDNSQILGIRGELGIRYGLEFYANTPDGKKLIATSEIDVLDLPLQLLAPLEAGSKEMFCLINKLIDDPKFMLFMDYALPVRKMLASIAIYNNVNYLFSIGQTVTGEKNSNVVFNADVNKPGIKVNADGIPVKEIGGWFPKSDRQGLSLFVLTWDEWDKQTLKKSVSVLKRMFKAYYYSRDFGKQQRPDPTAAQVAIQNLKEKFKFAPGDRSVPWFHGRVSNPFNAAGGLCTKKED